MVVLAIACCWVLWLAFCCFCWRLIALCLLLLSWSLSSISFSLGLSVVFILLGLAANSMASILIFYQNELRIGSGLLIIIFGLHFIGLLRVPFLQKELRLNLDIKKRGNFLPPFFLGLTFAFGWTPCIGPILGSILAIIAQDVSVLRGLVLMIFYSLGLSLPFIGVAYLLIRGVFITRLISKYSLHIERFTGGFLIFIGVLDFEIVKKFFKFEKF